MLNICRILTDCFPNPRPGCPVGKSRQKTKPVCCPFMLILVWLSHYVYRGCFYTQTVFVKHWPGCCPIIFTLSATSIHKHTHRAWLLSQYMYLGWHKCWRRLWQDCRARAAILPRTREPAVPQFAPGGEEESPPGMDGWIGWIFIH